jgi:deazaflavin-dependent oxidoreductase (nitroreductase family)
MANAMFKLMTATHVALYHATNGRIGGSMLGGRVLLLTTTGNKTGKTRTVPVMYFDLDGTTHVVASMGGSPTDPAWYKNLKSNPTATIQIGGTKRTVRAETLTGAARERAWEACLSQPKIGAQFVHYAKKTRGKREIPVVALRDAAS